MKSMKRVMLITSVFPPSWGAGVQRVSKLYKYLPDYGYDPIVLTTEAESYGRIDPSMAEDLGRGEIIRLRVLNWRFVSSITHLPGGGKTPQKKGLISLIQSIYPFFFIPDDRMLWIPTAILHGYRAIQKYKVGMLYSTSPHPSSHLIGLCLKRLTGLPWVADFRDPWVGNPFSSHPSKFHRLWDIRLERWVVQKASKIIAISEPILDGMKKRYPDLKENQFQLLTHSFDPDDFVDPQKERSFQDKLVISHAGTFYGHRSPETFLKGLIHLLDQIPDWRNRIEVFFIGSWLAQGETIELLKELEGVVKCIPVLPYKEMIQWLRRSHLLLLIPGPGEGTLTGKVFDYLALRKPIFLLSQGNTALEKILNKTKNGFIVPYGDMEQITRSLRQFVEAFLDQGKVDVEIDEEEVRSYSSIEMVRKFSEILDGLMRFEKGKTSIT